jgi:hypothetical protein
MARREHSGGTCCQKCGEKPLKGKSTLSKVFLGHIKYFDKEIDIYETYCKNCKQEFEEK